jgi:putative transposase
MPTSPPKIIITMDKYRNKYRIPSSRLKNWNYGWNASYFVTICTKNREHFFGHIENGVMHLNELGQIAEQEWIKTPGIRPDMNLELGVFVVMPNHFHAIIIIGENQYNRGAAMRGGTTYGPQSKNLGSIMRGFKSAVTTQIREMHHDFGWQTRFHDHIIRNQESFERIQEYIINNPSNWANDKFHC